jgi:2-keto-3-deoxy-6-phosphogluconate aldolase
LRDVLPKSVPLFAVGGVGSANLATWFEAGAFGVAIGGELYKPGDEPAAVAERARNIVGAWRALTSKQEPDASEERKKSNHDRRESRGTKITKIT